MVVKTNAFFMVDIFNRRVKLTFVSVKNNEGGHWLG